MSLLGFFFGSNNQEEIQVKSKYADSNSIDSDERPYYKSDDYYVLVTNPGTSFEKSVVTFDERKKTSSPTKNGLYVPEVLLLYYCKKGDYPKPKNGYPGFWWFEYGIRDVGTVLKSLAIRGFIELNNDKYCLTELGKSELQENEYVPYMHSHKYKTEEGSKFGKSFTIWDVNNLLKDKDMSKWKEYVGEFEQQCIGMNIAGDISKPLKSNKSYDGKELLEYIKSKQNSIIAMAETPGDGLDEELKGIEYKKAGKIKDALFYLYIAIEKQFYAPTTYKEAAILLRKYKLYDEEMKVLNKGIIAMKKGGLNPSELEERKNKLQAIIEKQS